LIVRLQKRLLLGLRPVLTAVGRFKRNRIAGGVAAVMGVAGVAGCDDGVAWVERGQHESLRQAVSALLLLACSILNCSTSLSLPRKAGHPASRLT
jgi:hypothetical protein